LEPRHEPEDAPTDVRNDALTGTPYQTIAAIGQGGMGEVVEAMHVALGKRVVVKLLHAHLSSSPHLVDRLRLEAQVLARLAHPNIVAVSDLGRTLGGRPYLVMDRLVGRTLRDVQKERGAVTPTEAVDWVRQGLAGLSCAHEAGLVHRDIKLDNIFLCDPEPQADGRGRIKLLDFGITKVLEASASLGGPAPVALPTAEGMLVGTPRFASPEQCYGKPVDARSDVYSMGLVLYALLAGRGAFQHIRGALEVLRAQVALVPEPPSAHAPHVHRELDAVVMKAIEKRADDRFQTAAVFRDALALALMRAVSPAIVTAPPDVPITPRPRALAARVPVQAASEPPQITRTELRRETSPLPAARAAMADDEEATQIQAMPGSFARSVAVTALVFLALGLLLALTVSR